MRTAASLVCQRAFRLRSVLPHARAMSNRTKKIVRASGAVGRPWANWRGDPLCRCCARLGCSRGEYTVECAAARPDVLFVGLDVDGVCVMRAAERAIAQRRVERRVRAARRLRFVGNVWRGRTFRNAAEFPHAVSEKKKAHYRLTHFERLMSYRPLLAPGAFVRLRTDSMPLRDFSLTQLKIAGYDVQWNTDDVRGMFPNEPWSGYEHKLVAPGAPVCGFAAVPGPAPESPRQTAPLSLVSYLPEDIENLVYVPHGMQGCVENMKGRRANRRAKGLFGMDTSDYLVRWGPRRMGIYRELCAVTLALVYFPLLKRNRFEEGFYDRESVDSCCGRWNPHEIRQTQGCS